MGQIVFRSWFTIPKILNVKLAFGLSGKSIVPISLVVFSTIWLGLDSSRLWDRDEPRNARCAIEMLERGDWIVPTFNDQLRTHKPILLYWLQMVCFSIFGETDFAARAASAFMATIAVTATYGLGSRLINPNAGFWASAALASSLMFVVAGRAATPDACLIATSALGVLGLVLHWQSGSKQFTRYGIGGYIALGLAMLAKGPVGIVLPMMVMLLWGFVQLVSFKPATATTRQRIKRTMLNQIRYLVVEMFQQSTIVIQRLKVFNGLMLAVAIAAPWYIWVGIRTDGVWLSGFFFEHNLGRAISAMEGHQGGWWFYPAASLVGLFPWSLMLLPIVFWTMKAVRKDSMSPAVQLGLIWIGVYMVVFSLARTKLPSYITPSYPGAALLIGGFLSQWANRQLVLSNMWLRIAAGVFALTAVLVMSAISYLSICEQMPDLLPHLLWSVGFLGVAAFMIHATWSGEQPRLPWAILVATVLFLSGLFAAAGPAAGRYRGDLTAILALRTYLDNHGDSLRTEWMSLRSIEPSWVYYLRMPITEQPKIDLAINQTDGVPLEQAVEHLRKPSGRLIVDASESTELEKLLEQQYQLSTKRSVVFKSFLKSNDIVVLQACSSGTSEPSTHRVATKP